MIVCSVAAQLRLLAKQIAQENKRKIQEEKRIKREANLNYIRDNLDTWYRAHIERMRKDMYETDPYYFVPQVPCKYISNLEVEKEYTHDIYTFKVCRLPDSIDYILKVRVREG